MKKWISLLGIGVVVAATLPIQAQAAEPVEPKTYNTNGVVEFIPNPDPTLPVDPTNPNPTNPVTPIDPTDPEGPTPGTQGPLSIDYASSFDFGINKISNADVTYYARAQEYSDRATSTPNYVQISDNRGTNAGWTLSVTQNGDFTATVETLNDVLTGAEIILTEPTVVSNSTADAPSAFTGELKLNTGAQTVMSAAQDKGAGTWVQRWGTVKEEADAVNAEGEVEARDITEAVMLKVPGQTPKDAVSYETTLTWTLSDVPGL